jgi:hypothetical protein
MILKEESSPVNEVPASRDSQISEVPAGHAAQNLDAAFEARDFIGLFASRSMRVLASRSGEIWSSKQVPSSKLPSIMA